MPEERGETTKREGLRETKASLDPEQSPCEVGDGFCDQVLSTAERNHCLR